MILLSASEYLKAQQCPVFRAAWQYYQFKIYTPNLIRQCPMPLIGYLQLVSKPMKTWVTRISDSGTDRQTTIRIISWQLLPYTTLELSISTTLIALSSHYRRPNENVHCSVTQSQFGDSGFCSSLIDSPNCAATSSASISESRKLAVTIRV